MVPKYLNETIPFEYKGPIGALSQCMITLGIFWASILGYIFMDKNQIQDPQVTSWLQNNIWRIIWVFPILLSCIQILLLWFVFDFDTPFALKKDGNFEKLTELMKKLYLEE
jgi:MFS family permease